MSSQGFDASSIKRSTWIAGGGAVVLLISTFLSWAKFDVGPASLNVSGWDTGALGKLVFFVALIAIGLLVVEHMKVDTSQVPIPVPLALVGVGALGVLFVVLRYIDFPDGWDRAWGIYVAFLAALALTYGGWLKLQESS